MALRYHPPSIVVEYAKKGKLYHHRMDLPLPPGGEIPRDEVHTTAQLQQTHNNYLQNISVEQIRLFVRMLLDHQRMKASGTDFTVGQRVEVHWRNPHLELGLRDSSIIWREAFVETAGGIADETSGRRRGDAGGRRRTS